MPIQDNGSVTYVFNVVAMFLGEIYHMCTVTLGVETWFETQLKQ